MSKTPATDWYQDDRPELWDDDPPECDLCGGDGVVGWLDHPELHGDDNAEGLEDHLVTCPRCFKSSRSQADHTQSEARQAEEETGGR